MVDRTKLVMKVSVFLIVLFAFIVNAHAFVADPVVNSFSEFFRPYTTTVQGRVRDVDLWYDRKSKSYEIHAEFPGVNEEHLKLWGDESNIRKPILYLEINTPSRNPDDTADTTPNTRGGNVSNEKITLRILLPEDADFRKGTYKLKDGVFSASVPRISDVPKKNEIPLSLSTD